MKEKLIIIGAGGHGKVVADIANRINKWEEICFLDDELTNQEVLGFKVIGTIQDIEKYKKNTDFIVAIGNNEVREMIFNKLKEKKISITSLIHPDSVIGLDVNISSGTVVMPGVVINASTKIGHSVILNTSASIDHDCQIDDFVHISPGVKIAGNVSIGKKSWLGIGSNVINNLNICQDVVIGAGAVVNRDIYNSGVFVGVPIRRL